jgi:Uma2 family endonuclease
MELAHKKYLFTVDFFNGMVEQGMVKPTDRLELIEGEIYEMSPIGNLHARCVKYLNNLLVQYLAGKFIIGIQDPIILDDISEPLPDVAVLRYRDDFYKQSLPFATDVLLIIEVADTTAKFDRTIKFPKYASARIPEAWLIDLEAERIEVHSAPEAETYQSVKIYQRGEEISSETLPEIKFTVDDIFG